MSYLRSFFQRHVNWLSLALVAAVAIAIYAYILPLPFFRDDMVMLLWLRDMPWGKLWVDATGFPYYRPLSFSTLKLSELAFGWPEPVSLHVLNLALHAANSVMVALLAQLTFSVDVRYEAKQGARMADRIFKGTKPAVLPVETAEYYLSINLKKAQEIGLNIPDEILRQAETVIR